MRKQMQNWFFKQMHSKNLIYNTCWEDPRCDNELLQFDKESEIVMITSAGCNALSYLVNEPNQINCVDMNPKQNALLELKKAFFKLNDYEHLFEAFGHGKITDAKAFYKNRLREKLPKFAQKYWDKRIKYFNGKGVRKSFYFYGTSGFLAWYVQQYLKSKKSLYGSIQEFFKSPTVESQAEIYQKIDEEMYSKFLVWMFNRHFVMTLMGVPKSQQKLFVNKYDDGAFGFVKSCMRHVFSTLPANENYFWQVYFNGHYTKDCCPDYLREEYFYTIKEHIDSVNTHTTTMSQFLKDNPKSYSHFILLDHQDWLADNNKAELEEEWRLILKNSKKGTKILLRSAADEVNFFPEFVLDSITFETEKTQQIHLKDRVGTYASTYLGIVN